MVLGDNVFLQTDEEVDVFAKKKINIINGNLIIGAEKGTDSISNIDALNLLNEIKYKLIVNPPTFKGDLKPLQNLRSVGGIMVNGEQSNLKRLFCPTCNICLKIYLSFQQHLQNFV